MTLLLAGDIGGTKTILRLVQSQPSQPGIMPELSTLHEQTYSSREFPDLVPMVRQFLQAAADHAAHGQASDTVAKVERACFGIAGPVVNNTSRLTNLSWWLDADHLTAELAIPQVSLINDFAAIGYGVLGLGADDLHTLQTGEPQPDAPIAVIGAGTGLGQAFLIRQGLNYRVFASEGGHADFAPRSELEFQLLLYLRDKHNINRVSVERVVSGAGIIAVYEFLRDRGVAEESAAIANLFKAWHCQIGQDEKTIDPAAEISQAALSHQDYLCEKTMELFIAAYGAEAGNLALKLLPYGGLYVAGGIAAKNLALIQRGEFLRALLQKGRMSPVLERVPVHIVLNPKVGLIGAALYAACGVC